MTFQISKIILYSHNNQNRVLNFKLGKVNIITGGSHTGKTALIRIIDYCLGSAECEVPSGIIKTSVKWYALLLNMDDKEIFVARKAPELNAKSSTAVYYEVGNRIEIPQNNLASNTTIDEFIKYLADIIGINFINIPPEGQTRRPLRVSLRHSINYSFLPQDEINQRYLIHGQEDYWTKLAIKDTINYLLGAVDFEFIEKYDQLRQKKRKIKDLEQQLSLIDTKNEESEKTINFLLSECHSVGLIDNYNNQLQNNEKIEILQQVLKTPLKEVDSYNNISNEKYQKLIEERNQIQDSIAKYNIDLTNARTLLLNEEGYSKEVREQQGRLQSIKLFKNNSNNSICPLCAQELNNSLPKKNQIEELLNKTTNKLEGVYSHSPVIKNSIKDLENEISKKNLELKNKRKEIDDIYKSNDVLRKLNESSSRQHIIIGRINQFLDNLPTENKKESILAELNKLQQDEKSLEEQIGNETIQTNVENILSVINDYMTKMISNLKLEYSEATLRFDIHDLTIYAMTKNYGAIPLKNMGSAENWVWLHIIFYLSLHNWFIIKDRPIPRFLFIDQPSQVYFPPELDIKEGSIENISENDKKSLEEMFKIIFSYVSSHSNKFQIIITEHADLHYNDYQNAIIEKWRGEKKLVPIEWENV